MKLAVCQKSSSVFKQNWTFERIIAGAFSQFPFTNILYWMDVSLTVTPNTRPNQAPVTSKDCFPALLKCPLRSGESYQAYLFDTITETNARVWNSIAKGKGAYLQWEYLQALQNGANGFPEMYYSLIYDKGNPVGIGVFQLTNFEGGGLGANLAQKNRFAGLIAKTFGLTQDNFSYKLLVCGNAFSTGEHGFAFLPEANPDKALDALVDAVNALFDTIDRQEKVTGVLFKEFYSGSLKDLKHLKSEGFSEFATEPNLTLEMDPNWKTWEDYLEDLNSKYRVKANRAYSKSENLSARPLSLEEIKTHKIRIFELYEEVCSRAEYRLGRLNPEVFLSLKELLGDKFIMDGYFLGDKLVGFLSGFLSENLLETHMVGIDYAANQDNSIYPRMLCDYIRYGITHQVKEISFGRTAGEIKSTIGARPESLKCYFRHRSTASNQFLKILARYIKPSGFPLREPFKKTWYQEKG